MKTPRKKYQKGIYLFGTYPNCHLICGLLRVPGKRFLQVEPVSVRH